jgi:zinc protease
MVAASPAQVKAAASKWLRANYYTMTVKPFAKLAAAKPVIDRKLLPALGKPPDFKFPAIARAQLEK